MKISFGDKVIVDSVFYLKKTNQGVTGENSPGWKVLVNYFDPLARVTLAANSGVTLFSCKQGLHFLISSQ